jgi:hypothetical protein
MDAFKKHAKVGPGGIKCACCGPAPGKERKELRRLARRRLKQELARELQKQEACQES